MLGIGIIGGGFIALTITAFVDNWKYATIFSTAILALFGAAWLGLESDLDKNNPD